jgi:hypothetical protein
MTNFLALVQCIGALLFLSNHLACSQMGGERAVPGMRSATVVWYGNDEALGRRVPVKTLQIADATEAAKVADFLEDFDRRTHPSFAGKWAVELEITFAYGDGSGRKIVIGNECSHWREPAFGAGDRVVRAGMREHLEGLAERFE